MEVRGVTPLAIRCPSIEDGAPLVIHNRLVLEGFVEGGAGMATLRVELSAAFAGLDLETESGNPVGTAFRLELDTSVLEPGTERLLVRAQDGAGSEAQISREVELAPYRASPRTSAEAITLAVAGDTAIWLDLPIGGQLLPPSSYFEAIGWAHAEDGLDRVVVTIDGHHRFDANHGLRRRDLDEHSSKLGRAGFAVRIDPRDIPPGPHTLTVVAIGREGSAIGLERHILLRHESPDAPPTPPSAGSAEEARFLVVPPRDVPGAEPKRPLLARAESTARRRLAGKLADGRRVLDLSGDAQAGQLLAASGASEVVSLADLADLAEVGSGFDLVLLFESLESAEDPAAALGSIAACHAPDGIVLAVAADADFYPPGDPRHRTRLTAADLERELRARWANVLMLRQGSVVASAIGVPGDVAGRPALADPETMFAHAPFTVCLASNATLPQVDPVVILSEFAPEVERWHELAASWEARALWAESRVAVTEAELTFVTFSLVKALEEGPGSVGVAGTGGAPAARWNRLLPARAARRLRNRLRR